MPNSERLTLTDIAKRVSIPPDKVANIFMKIIPENQILIGKYSDVKPLLIEDKDEGK